MILSQDMLRIFDQKAKSEEKNQNFLQDEMKN